MIKADMNKIVIFTDNSSIIPETYIVEFKEDVSTYKIIRPTETWTIEQAIEYCNTVGSFINALVMSGIKCTVIRVDELTIIHNNINNKE